MIVDRALTQLLADFEKARLADGGRRGPPHRWAGLATGLGVMLLLRAAIESQLFEVRFFDPLVLASVAGVLKAVALVACLLPARRAARTDPVTALNL